MPRPPVPRLARAAAGLAGALALVLGLSGSALASERVTFRLLGSSPIYANAVNVHTAAGGTVHVRPARYHYRVTGGSPAVTTEAAGNCVDLSHYIVTGRDYEVDLQSAADAPELGSPSHLAAGWLLSKADELIAAAADPGLEAGAIQVAVWQLSGQARDLDAPSSDPALNARVAELRAMSAGRSVPSALALSVAGADTCLDTGAAVTVTGTPGAVVDLSVPATPGGAPTATVSPAQVTLDANGVAGATMRSSAAGAVTVTATTSAPTLLRATKLPGATAPQDQLLLRPGTLSAEATHAFIDCSLYLFGPGAPGAAAPLAPSPPAPAPPTPPLVISLETPGLAAPGGQALYTLRVTNNSARTARGVRVAQRLERGVSALRARGPRGTSARADGRSARWTIAALKPGRSATLTLRARVGRSLAGGVAHTSAALRGAGSARAHATGATAVVRRVGKTEQGF